MIPQFDVLVQGYFTVILFFEKIKIAGEDVLVGVLEGKILQLPASSRVTMG